MATIPDYETISMEEFVITKIRTFINEPFFCCWCGEGDTYLWYFTLQHIACGWGLIACGWG